MRKHIRNMALDSLRDAVVDGGEPEYRYRQLVARLYGKLDVDFAAMTDLPAEFRSRLAVDFDICTAVPVAIQESATDGTRKFLLEFSDGARVEAVSMKYEKRTTMCVSSQVGCPLDCVFCETARGKFQRNLTAGEILDQICMLKADAGLASSKINVVFMGMGEPLLNLEAVVAAVRTMNDALGLDLPGRRITVSTSSFPERIRELADSEAECSLALSLNAATDELRERIMPKASKFTIEELLGAARYFVAGGRRRVTLEYVMLSGINTRDEDADALADLVRDQPFKVNLIPYNPGRSGAMAGIGEDDIDRFVARLLPAASAITVRRSRGVDIDAACGQLWTQSLLQKKKPVQDAA